MLPASAVPVRVGIESFVMLSVGEVPESEAATRSGIDGGSGAVVSVLRVMVSDTVVDRPATSVTRYQTVFGPSPDVRVQAGAAPDTGVNVTLSFEAAVVATPEVASPDVTLMVTLAEAVVDAPLLIAIVAVGLTVSSPIVSETVVDRPAASVTLYQTVLVPFADVRVHDGVEPDVVVRGLGRRDARRRVRR